MLTSYAEDEALFSAIMAGAAGYALKEMRGPDLVDGVHRIARGESLLDPSLISKVLDRLRHPAEPEELAGLTERRRGVARSPREGRLGSERRSPWPHLLRP